MKAKKNKVYTLAQVGEFLGFSGRSIRDFVQVGLIHAFPNPTWMAVTEEELKRVMREGLDTSEVTARLVAMRNAAAKTAKKRTKRRNAVGAKTIAKKQTKRRVAAAAAKRNIPVNFPIAVIVDKLFQVLPCAVLRVYADSAVLVFYRREDGAYRVAGEVSRGDKSFAVVIYLVDKFLVDKPVEDARRLLFG